TRSTARERSKRSPGVSATRSTRSSHPAERQPAGHDHAVLLAELADTSRAVAATAARSTKIALLADLLTRLEPDEVVPAVALLAGAARQGRIGVGWATVRDVLRPVLPMLASTAADVGEAIEGCGMSSVEWKLDGARVQVHRADAEVRIFTRNLNDITDRLPGVAAIVRSMPANSLILDAEVIGVRLDERPELFQSTMSRFSRQAAASPVDGQPDVEQPVVEEPVGEPVVDTELRAWFFDCLHLDGRDLIDETLVERLAALERVVGRWRIPGTVTDDPVVGAAVLDEALAAGHEGVMVKAVGSRYEAGRRGKSWRKVKPVRTFDLVVLAAEWGHGRRRGWLSNLHLGARDPRGEGFVMVGKTFKGLTDALLTWQTERLRELAVEERGITVFVRPELVV